MLERWEVRASGRLDEAAKTRQIVEVCDYWFVEQAEPSCREEEEYLMQDNIAAGIELAFEAVNAGKPLWRVWDGSESDPAFGYFIGTEDEVLAKILSAPIEDRGE